MCVLLSVFCFSSVSYSGDSQEFTPEAKTKTYTNNDVKAFGLSWDSTPKEGLTYIKAKGFDNCGFYFYRPPPYSLSNIYFRLTGKELGWLEELYKTGKGGKIRKALETTSTGIASQGGMSENIGPITYMWSNKQGLIMCTVVVESREFGLESLKKYGNPTIVKGKLGNPFHFKDSLYVYPIQGNVGIVFYGPPTEKHNGYRRIYYVNIPRLEAYNLDVKAYIDDVEAKKKIKANKESKDF